MPEKTLRAGPRALEGLAIDQLHSGIYSPGRTRFTGTRGDGQGAYSNRLSAQPAWNFSLAYNIWCL
jgi:hypothetical protein